LCLDYGLTVTYFSNSVVGLGLSFREKSSFQLADHPSTI